MTEEKSKTEILAPNEYKIMDNRDENQILSELQGHYLTEFVYSFKAGGRDVIGLSWAGVKELAYRYGGIQVESCNIEDKGEFWLVTCKALDIEKRNSRFGVATQSKMMKRRDGSAEPDDFALQKATSKAQRNAIRALMPEIAVKQYIDIFLNEKAQPPRPSQPPVNVTPSKPVEVAKYSREALEQDLVEVNLLEQIDIKPEEDNTTMKALVRLETPDFIKVCRIAEKYGGKWVKENGVWVIPTSA
ncbi:MAG: hypothetical protein WC325_10335 [Candidatus Bathyarchaeia archaeon]